MINRLEIIDNLDLPQDVFLKEHEGVVFSANEFLYENAHLLSLYEQNRLKELSCDFTETNAYFSFPLAISDKGEMPASSIGSRSANIAEKKVYIKACRPVTRIDLNFPSISVDFVTGNVSDFTIPFGVMTKASAVRELFGCLLFSYFQWPQARTPTAVFQYTTDGKTLGYAIAFIYDPKFERVEKHIQKETVSIDSLLAISVAHDLFDTDLSLGELDIFGNLQSSYLNHKAELLVKTHVEGVFRGFLNSNLGNDFVHKKKGQVKVALADFDTFHLIDINILASAEQTYFIRYAMIEAVKGMLPILDCVWLVESEGYDSFQKRVSDKVLKQSSWLKLYTLKLSLALDKLGWSKDTVKKGMQLAYQHSLFKQCLKDSIINSQSLMYDYKIDETIYRAQF